KNMYFFFFQAEDGIRDRNVTGVQTCALPISFYHYQARQNDKRSIIVPPLLAKELLEKMVERDLTVETGEQNFKHVDIVQDSLPFHFALTKNEREDLLLEMNDVAEGIYFKPYEILFSQGTFYFPSKEQIPVLEQINQLGMDDHQLP